MSKVLVPTVLITFGDGLESIQFLQDGNLVDPRLILRGLAAGALRVTYSEERNGAYLLSQTFTIEATDKA